RRASSHRGRRAGRQPAGPRHRHAHPQRDHPRLRRQRHRCVRAHDARRRLHRGGRNASGARAPENGLHRPTETGETMNRTFLIAISMLLALPLRAQKTLGDGIKELATQISTSAAKQQKQKIAVLPFRELEGQPTVLGTYLAEELVTNLFQLGNFEIVERQLLDKVLGELKVEQSGAIDPSTAKEIGRVTGVDAIVTGSITDLQSFVGVNCRLIDTTTGKIFGAAQTKNTKDDDVKKIMSTAVAAHSPAAPRGPAAKKAS